MKISKPSSHNLKPKTEGVIVLPTIHRRPWYFKVVIASMATLLAVALLLLAVRLLSADRFYPGSSLYGVSIGGMTKSEAVDKLKAETTAYGQSPILLSTNSAVWRIKPAKIELKFDIEQDIQRLFSIGRSGDFLTQGVETLRLLIGQTQPLEATYSLNQEKLAETLSEPIEKISSPTTNALFRSDNGIVSVEPGAVGKRLDLGGLNYALLNSISTLSHGPVDLPIANIKPAISEEALASHQTELENLATNPLILVDGQQEWKITTDNLLSWFSLPTQSNPPTVASSRLLNDYYRLGEKSADFSFDKKAVSDYVASLAKQVDGSPVNATLGLAEGKVVVTKEGTNGRKLDVEASANSIFSALKDSAADRRIALVVETTKPEIRTETLDSLGIKELVAEATTTFPGSSFARLTNIRVGSAQFNNTVVKPGEIFSFGERMGEIGPEQGYLPSKVIGEGRVNNEYGGGMCQVSTTAYRAALLAGFPILERVSHSFAVEYYTEPYGVPGVDAAVNYPGVDMKFRNDSGHYLFIQTEMKGSTLTFRYYGTKTKSGVIRGPQFISGSLDPKIPSQTVFWRDVVVDGKVVKTDTINTWYRSSLDFPAIQ